MGSAIPYSHRPSRVVHDFLRLSQPGRPRPRRLAAGSGRRHQPRRRTGQPFPPRLRLGTHSGRQRALFNLLLLHFLGLRAVPWKHARQAPLETVFETLVGVSPYSFLFLHHPGPPRRGHGRSFHWPVRCAWPKAIAVRHESMIHGSIRFQSMDHRFDSNRWRRSHLTACQKQTGEPLMGGDIITDIIT